MNLKLRNCLLNGVLFLISSVISVLFIEFVLRFTVFDDLIRYCNHYLPQHYLKADAELGYDIQQNFGPSLAYIPLELRYVIWSNELGCFDDPYHGEDYILLAGDSFAHCFAPHENKWGTIVEKNVGLSVLNCAVLGYGTQQEYIKMRRVTQQIGKKPKMIIVSYCINDLLNDYLMPSDTIIDGFLIRVKSINDLETGSVQEAVRAELVKKYDTYRIYGQSIPASYPVENKIKIWLRWHSIVWNLIPRQRGDVINSLKRKIFGHDSDSAEKGDKTKTVRSLSPPHISSLIESWAGNFHYSWLDQAWESHLANVMKFKEYAVMNNIPLLFVLVPMKEQVYPSLMSTNPLGEFDTHIHHQRIESFLRQQDIAVLNLVPIFKKHARKLEGRPIDPELDLFWKYDGHFSISGDALAGQAVSRYLMEHNYL